MKNYLLLMLAVVVFTACKDQKIEIKEESPVFDWEDKSVYSTSNFFDNQEDEPEQDRHVDPQLAEWLLKEAIYSENAEIYDANSYDENNNLNKKLTKQEISETLYKIRTTQQEDSNNPGNFFEVTDTFWVKTKDIVQILTKEEWSINKSNMSFQKNVKMMAPITITRDEEGNERGKAILFWVKMK